MNQNAGDLRGDRPQRYVGQAVPMVDGGARVRGSLTFNLDVVLPHMLHGRILRSPHASARVVSVDTSRAELIPGVRVVVGPSDLTMLADPYFGEIIADQTPLAIDRVHYVGDAVAAVAAETIEAANEAIEAIEVDYELFHPALDVESALAENAPLVHLGERRVTAPRPDVVARSFASTNVLYRFTQERGESPLDAPADGRTVRRTYETPMVAHVPMEPHNVVAYVQNDVVSIWAAVQSPHIVQAQLARIFGIPLSNVRIAVASLGGSYGAKTTAKIEPLAALMSAKSGRPVRIVASRYETFLLCSQHASRVKLTTIVNSDGRILSHIADCIYQAGPYASTTPNVVMRAYAATGPYRVDSLRTESTGVYTNTPPAGPFRGYGITQVAWAHESQMDEIATALGMDALKFRLLNLLSGGDTFTTGEVLPDLHFRELLLDAAHAIDWGKDEPAVSDRSKVRGKGLAVIIKGTANPSVSSCTLRLIGDGSLLVQVGTVEMGQGSNTVLSQIAADAVGISLERVRVLSPDTQSTPFDSMTAASRSTFCMGQAIERAAAEIQRQLRDLASDFLEAASADLVLADDKVHVRGDEMRSVSYAELIRWSRQGNLLGTGTFVAAMNDRGEEVGLSIETGQGVASAEWHPAAVGAEVEVDTETGRIDVLRLHASIYAGRLVNPRLCELQVEGSAIFGVGQALFEELALDENGAVLNPTLADYMVPSFVDVPRTLTVRFLQPPGVLPMHGVGETALPPIAPAIGNAVARAIGIRLYSLPMTPENVLRALSERRAEQHETAATS